MDDKITIDLDHETLAAVSRLAEAHGKSVDQEVADIVKRNVSPRPERAAGAREWARHIRAMTPRGVAQTDSLVLLREDRDR
jgi:DUF971 family protein